MENAKRKTIKEWSSDERPREKMLKKGPEVLSNSELLAILIGSGTTDKSALDLARELLESAGQQLSVLSRMSIHEIKKIRGLGPARAVTISAALELSRRRASEISDEEEIILSAHDAEKAVIGLLRDKAHEEFWVICLNNRNKVIHKAKISEGGFSSAHVDLKKLMKITLDTRATSIILAHNHPSGTLFPSEQDISLTHRIQQAAQMLDIRLLDHIIITETAFYSFSDHGQIA